MSDTNTAAGGPSGHNQIHQYYGSAAVTLVDVDTLTSFAMTYCKYNIPATTPLIYKRIKQNGTISAQKFLKLIRQGVCAATKDVVEGEVTAAWSPKEADNFKI